MKTFAVIITLFLLASCGKPENPPERNKLVFDVPIGFEDVYDFNPKPLFGGERSLVNEIKTRAVNYWGNEYGAEPFRIYFRLNVEEY